MHSDINDHSIFKSKFSEGAVFSFNPYLKRFEEVKGRKGIFRDEGSEQKFSFVSLPSKDYKLVDHLPLFEEVTTQLVECEDISTARVHIEDRTYEEDTKAIRTIHLLLHTV